MSGFIIAFTAGAEHVLQLSSIKIQSPDIVRIQKRGQNGR
jgi:hypothetical protein